MMQETGNKRTGSAVLSVRLTPDGFYFDDRFVACPPQRSLEMLKEQFAAYGGRMVSVEIDSLSTVVVPESCYDNVLAEGYLTANNMLPAGYVPVRAQWEDVVIVMSCRADVAKWLQERFGNRVSFISPLAKVLDAADKKETFKVWFTDANVYIALWNKGLKFAQVLPYSSLMDFGYYISSLTAEYGLRKAKLCVGGKLDKEEVRELGRLFPRMVYADNKRNT